MSSSVLCGQAALVGLPTISRNNTMGDNSDKKKKKSQSSNGDNDNAVAAGVTFVVETPPKVEDVVVPEHLKVDKKRLKGEQNSGMEVFKLSKTGKLQPRRLAFSPDNRCLHITTNRVRSLKGLFKAATGMNGGEPISTKVINISRIDRILTGVQLSKRFLWSIEQPDAPEELTNGRSESLTIVYRQTKAEVDSSATFSFDTFAGSPVKSTNGKDVVSGIGQSNSDNNTNSNSPQKSVRQQHATTNIFAGWEFLDLVIPNPKDLKSLVKILKELIERSRDERKSLEKTVNLLRYHWIDMGKTNGSENLTANEWSDLCNRLNAPLRKQDAVALFRDMKNELRRACKELGTDMDLDTGLPPWAIAELLNDLQYHSMALAGFKYVKQDPMLRLWHEILGSDPVPILEHSTNRQKLNSAEGMIEKAPSVASASSDIDASSTPNSKSISAVALLSFIRSQQKEFRTTLEDAQALMTALQSKKSCKMLASEADSPDGTNKENDPRQTVEERLSKSHFYELLMSDANDLMDPRKGRVAADDMTHPLSSYWIMSSHDTYLNCYNHKRQIMDDQMYLAALYRGVRCLEIDVWDGIGDSAGEPVIAKQRPLDDNDPMLHVTVALLSVRQYLQANPKTFPVIINIENHCSFSVQEKLAAHIFETLGSIGLIVVPDDSQSIDESDLLPSPASMRGKVLLMGKRPKTIQEGAKVIHDDYDDENDIFIDDAMPTVKSREEDDEDIETGIVVGFDSKGPIRAITEAAKKNVVKHTPGELLYIAKQDLEDAELEAAHAQVQANEAAEEAKKADEIADRLIRNAGLSDESVQELLAQLRGLEIDPDEHVALLSRNEGEGVEVQEFFAGAVQSAKISFTEADQRALRAAEDATHALQKLNQATAKLREAEELLEESFVKGKKVVNKFQKAAKVARDKQEAADHANRRVEKLRQLLKECEAGANSAQNVVNTAMTEAKISEKRAAETEARAARAAATAQSDRMRAEEETRKEEELERQAASLHEQMISAGRAEREAKERLQRATVLLERVNDQIKLIESSTQFLREKQDMIDNISEEKKESKTPAQSGKLHSKLSAKIEERRVHSETVRDSSLEIGIASKRRQQAQELFEVKAHEWKKQAEIASKLRKVSDRSSHVAEDLAEHAEEEREAANLRKVARERAEKHVTEKDSYRLGLKTQLEEAERALVDANVQAAAARKEADRLSQANSSMDKHGHDDILAVMERRKATRDQLLADYEEKRIAKEEAERLAAESKRTFETSDQVYNEAMRLSEHETKNVDFKRRRDRNALAAVNTAKIAHKQAEHLIEKARYIESTVLEKQVILRRAKEYKERTDRLTEIPVNLAKMTFLHTTKHRHWEKSFKLPNTYCHSLAASVLERMARKDAQDHEDNLHSFTSTHMCRSFPSWKNVVISGELNTDPLFQWSLGCQLVSLNYGTFDEELLKADGRFRRNGSCGYVLKPDSIRSEGKLHERAESWKIQILCGQYFPFPASKRGSIGNATYINPMVKITVYGGDVEQRKGEHRTVVVSRNGLNPVFDDETGFTFKATNPSLAILTFTAWDVSESGEEEFIAGASMPVACIREGYRSVPLFDIHHTRTGAYEFASLLVKAHKM